MINMKDTFMIPLAFVLRLMTLVITTIQLYPWAMPIVGCGIGFDENVIKTPSGWLG
jgi:hypothetical protein